MNLFEITMVFYTQITFELIEFLFFLGELKLSKLIFIPSLNTISYTFGNFLPCAVWLFSFIEVAGIWITKRKKIYRCILSCVSNTVSGFKNPCLYILLCFGRLSKLEEPFITNNIRHLSFNTTFHDLCCSFLEDVNVCRLVHSSEEISDGVPPTCNQ